VADLNLDGRLDLATANTTSSDVSVGLNNGEGKGTFANPGQFATIAHATPVLADLEHDGADDVLVINKAGEILWRKGRPREPGAFEPPIIVNRVIFSSDSDPVLIPSREFVVIESFLGPLVASVDAQADAVSLFALRDGRFVRIRSLLTGTLPAQVATADLDGDGRADLVVRNAVDGTASVYLGDGSGNFHKLLVDLPLGLGVSDIRLADSDQSGTIDLIATNQVTGDVRIFYNLGDATFTRESRYHAGIGPYGLTYTKGTPTLYSLEETAIVAIGTFTRGGVLDLVTANPGSNTLGVLDGLGGGAFANSRRIFTDRPIELVRAADFDADGVTDVALLGSGRVTVHLGNGHGGFNAPIIIDAGPDPRGLSVVDIDRDGRPDLLVGNDFGDVLTLFGYGDGSFRPYPRVGRNTALAVADLNGDGIDDFVFGNEARDRVSVTFGGTGTRFEQDRRDGLLAPGAVTTADLNDDRIIDLIVANSGSNNVLVYLGQGGGQFAPARSFVTGQNPAGLTVLDLDSDGRLDLVVANEGSNDVSILFGQGQGTQWTLDLGPRAQVGGSGPVAVTPVPDTNGDGIPELLVTNSTSNNVTRFDGRRDGFLNLGDSNTFRVGGSPQQSFVGSFDGNPGLDAVTINRGTNDLTLVPDYVGGGVIPQSIPSGGLGPVAGFSGDFNSDGFSDLVVANNGNGRLALFLGSNTGLRLELSFFDPTLPHPSSLVFSSVSDGLLRFYASNEGSEVATLLSFSFGRDDGFNPPSVFDPDPGPGSPGPFPWLLPGADLGHLPLIFPGSDAGSPVIPAPGETEQVAQLVPLSETALALVATLSTVALDVGLPTIQAKAAGTPNGAGPLAIFSVAGVLSAISGADLLATFSGGEKLDAVSTETTGTLAQGASQSEDQDEAVAETDDTEEQSDDAQEDAAEEEAPAWIRFFAGLEEGFDRHRRAALDERLTGAGSPAGAAEWLAALDAVLDRWSLAERVANGGQPGPVEWLRQATEAPARVLDAAIHRLGSEERPQVTPPSPPIPEPDRSTPSQPDEPVPQDPADVAAEATSAASVPLVFAALLLARPVRPPRRRQGSHRIACACVPGPPARDPIRRHRLPR
jgi:hypothetical protein